MRDHTIDEALVELARTMKALKVLRAARREFSEFHPDVGRRQAAASRAALDCRYKLADLRAGR